MFIRHGCTQMVFLVCLCSVKGSVISITDFFLKHFKNRSSEKVHSHETGLDQSLPDMYLLAEFFIAIMLVADNDIS